MVRFKWDTDGIVVNVPELVLTSLIFAGIWFGIEYATGQIRGEAQRKNGVFAAALGDLEGLV